MSDRAVLAAVLRALDALADLPFQVKFVDLRTVDLRTGR